jgi:hypothetical protein
MTRISGGPSGTSGKSLEVLNDPIRKYVARINDLLDRIKGKTMLHYLNRAKQILLETGKIACDELEMKKTGSLDANQAIQRFDSDLFYLSESISDTFKNAMRLKFKTKELVEIAGTIMDKMENQKTGESQLRADQRVVRELNGQDKARLMLTILNIIMFAKETQNLFQEIHTEFIAIHEQYSDTRKPINSHLAANIAQLEQRYRELLKQD